MWQGRTDQDYFGCIRQITCTRQGKPAAEIPKRTAVFRSLRQGNELIVARDRRQASCAPVRFRRFNPFLRRGDKIPPDNSRTVQLGSTDENEVRSDSCGQDNFGLRREDRERAWNEVLIADLNFSGDD